MKDHRIRTTAAVQRRAQAEASIGKTTLAHSVQRRLTQRSTGPAAADPAAAAQVSAAPDDAAQVQAAAAQGVAGAGGALPHGDAIQQSFGKHDVSGVKAHTDDKAAAAAGAMGAEAYATGNDVAFAGEPSLHTAAHEAAHTVQQKGGVQLAGGVGAVGDPYERHADAVADAVVAGRSAEALLDASPGGGAGGGVQRAVQLNPTGSAAPAGAAPAGAAPAAPAGAAPADPAAATAAPAPGAPAPMDPALAAHKDALKSFFSSAGATIKGAADFGTIAAALAPAVGLYGSDPEAGGDTPAEIQKRYANTARGVTRAQTFYRERAGTTGDPKWAVAEQKFVTDRLAVALPDQANTLGDKMIAEGAKPPEAVSVKGVHLSNTEWDGLMKHAGVVLAPENADGGDTAASAGAVKADGGLAKVFSLNQVWGFMAPPLKAIWTTVYATAEAASAKFRELCKTQATIVHKPDQADVDAHADAAALTGRLAPYAALGDSFAGGVTGFCGMASDYVLATKSFAALETALALNAGNYPGGVGVVVKIPADQLDAAMATAQTTPGRGGPATDTNVLGKPSVFNSLMFSEFNYVCEDRSRGLTGGDGSNSGIPDPAGKAEVTVTNMPFSAFLGGGFEIFA